MPSKFCEVCGEKVTVASKDLKYLHDCVDFICSPECVLSKIKSFRDFNEQSSVINNCCSNVVNLDSLGLTAAYSWVLCKNFRSEYEAAVAEFLHSQSIPIEYENYSFAVGKDTYTPDFYIRSPYNCFIEVKGLFSIGKRAKLTSFRKQYPAVNFILVPWTLRSDFIERLNPSGENW